MQQALITRLPHTSRKGDLTAVTAHMFCALDQHHGGVGSAGKCDQHRSFPYQAVGEWLTRFGGQVAEAATDQFKHCVLCVFRTQGETIKL